MSKQKRQTKELPEFDRPIPTGMIGFLHIGRDGRPITRTPLNSPYSFDDYYLYNSGVEDSQGDGGVYSDHLHFKYPDTRERAYAESGIRTDQEQPDLRAVNAFLSILVGKPVLVTRIIRSCNQNNGYPITYWSWRNADVIKG